MAVNIRNHFILKFFGFDYKDFTSDNVLPETVSTQRSMVTN